MAETAAQKTARLQAEARQIREQRLYEERSQRATGMKIGTNARPQEKRKGGLFDAITGALRGK